MKPWWKNIGAALPLHSPSFILAVGFGLAILTGGVLLWLPVSHAAGRVGLLDALFTATSAVCVTGLTVVDTGTDFTRFGQGVILVLIQVGGLGVMTFAAAAMQMLGQRLSITTQAALSDSFWQRDAFREVRKVFRRILGLTVVIEVIGAAVLFAGLPHDRGTGSAVYSAVFHAVSAFCNAGFSIYRDSLSGLCGNTAVLVTIIVLVVAGGLGHTVLQELWSGVLAVVLRRPQERLTFHARVVLIVSALLIVFGAAGLCVTGLTPSETGVPSRMAAAVFQSVSARTAGFNTVDISRLPLASLLFIVFLMFVGGSPASCAGGIKTTSLAILFAGARSALRGNPEVEVMGRRISAEVLRRTVLLAGLALAWNAVGVEVLCWSEGYRPGTGLHPILFEQVSAFGTVGLSTGITPGLSTVGKLWVITTMFVGRLGPLTLAAAALASKTTRIRRPEGRLMIG